MTNKPDENSESTEESNNTVINGVVSTQLVAVIYEDEEGCENEQK